MIVQTAPADAAHFIIMQIDHADTSGQFAERFGGENFAPLHPRDIMLHVIRHHDDGWRAVDARPKLNPETDLPYHITQTPTELLIDTNRGSPDSNEAFHPYAGIISSMHTYGIYHGRYGLVERKLIDHLPENVRPQIETLLAAELERQERLRTLLEADEEMAPHATEDALMRNYRLLQFFDMLALHIQTTHPDQVGDALFRRVPKIPDEDVDIEATRIAPFVIRLSPWPFTEPEFDVYTSGRYMAPQAELDMFEELADRLYTLPVQRQVYRFTSGGL